MESFNYRSFGGVGESNLPRMWRNVKESKSIRYCLNLRRVQKEMKKGLNPGDTEIFEGDVCYIADKLKNQSSLLEKHKGPCANPIGEAEILNGENTDLNIILGLCVGHDTLFTEHSEAPVTTLVVKDPGHALPPRPEN